MYEALSSPGLEYQTDNEYVAKNQRPEGRSFLSVNETSTNGHTLPDADQFVPDPNKREWFADYCRWRFGRDATRSIITHVTTRADVKNDVL